MNKTKTWEQTWERQSLEENFEDIWHRPVYRTIHYCWLNERSLPPPEKQIRKPQVRGEERKKKTCPVSLAKRAVQKLYKLVKIFKSLHPILFQTETIHKMHHNEAKLFWRVILFNRHLSKTKSLNKNARHEVCHKATRFVVLQLSSTKYILVTSIPSYIQLCNHFEKIKVTLETYHSESRLIKCCKTILYRATENTVAITINAAHDG